MNCAPSDFEHYRVELTCMVERELHLGEGAVASDRNLSEYGLDSIAALTIAGDLEEELDIELPATLLWDYPSIDDLAAYLVSVKPSTAGDAA